MKVPDNKNESPKNALNKISMPIFVPNMRKCYLLKGWLSKADFRYTNRCSKYKKKSSKQLF